MNIGTALHNSKGSADQTERLIRILCATPSLMRVLGIARALHLPDWLVFSGAIYQPVLNHLTGRASDYGIKDYDLAYFDGAGLSYEAEDAIMGFFAYRRKNHHSRGLSKNPLKWSAGNPQFYRSFHRLMSSD